MTRFLLTSGLLCLMAVTNGCTQSQTRVSKGVAKQTFIHKYGVEVSAEEWSTRGKDGSVITSGSNGVVTTKNYRGGVLNGEATYTFPHSRTIQKTEQYEQGTLVRQVIHYPSGMPEREERVSGPDRRVSTTWYESGTPRSVEKYEGTLLVEGEYLDEKNSVESKIANGAGTRIMRDAYGQRTSTDEFEEGQLRIRTLYHPNGSPKEVISYRNGVIDGEKHVYLASGEPAAIETWTNGVQDGITVEFQNGEKLSEIPYLNGKRHGIERRFLDGEIVVSEITWENDNRHGPARTYVEGKPGTNWYHNGKLVSKVTYENLNGRTTL